MRRAMLSLCLALTLLISCERSPAPKTPVHVFAAASLTEAFTDLERSFERAHPDQDVILSFAGSQTLRLQLEQGAQADVFASANTAHMDALISADLIQAAKPLTTNTLVIVTPANSPILKLEQLTQAQRIVIGARSVPAGGYARAAIADMPQPLRAHIEAHIISEEPNVRRVLAKVLLDEADAAFVYKTDVLAQQDRARLRVIALPNPLQQRATYTIGALKRAPSPKLAQAWIEHTLSPTGQRALKERGFGP